MRWVMAAVVMMALMGCKRVEYVVKETVVTDTLETVKEVEVVKWRERTVKEKDSVVVEVKGDTVYRDRWKVVEVESVRVDSVKEGEKRDQKRTLQEQWQKESSADLGAWGGWIGMGLMAVVVILLLVLMIKKA